MRGRRGGSPSGRERDHAIRRAQHPPALFEVERIDRLVEAEPSDSPLLERVARPVWAMRKYTIEIRSPSCFCSTRSQPPDRPRAHARFLADLALRGTGGGLSVLDVAFRKDPPVAPSARLDEEVAGSLVRQLEDDGTCVRRAAQCRGSPTARCVRATGVRPQQPGDLDRLAIRGRILDDAREERRMKIALAVITTVLQALAFCSAYAHGDHKPKHGGIMGRGDDEISVELVMKSGTAILYVEDEGGTPLPTEEVKEH